MTVQARSAASSRSDLAGKRMLEDRRHQGHRRSDRRPCTTRPSRPLVAARTRAEGAGTTRFLQADVSTPAGMSRLAEATETVLAVLP